MSREREPALPARPRLAAGIAGAAVALVAVAGLRPDAALAQETSPPYQVPDRKRVKDLIDLFDKHASADDWVHAAQTLQKLLDLPADQSMVVRVQAPTPPRFEGSSEVARRMFDALPPQGRAAWEALSRRPAEELIERGVRLRRVQDLRDAARRFPAADVRRRAHDALAQLALTRGDFSEARWLLETLAGEQEPSERGETVARLAFVCAQSADPESMARVRELASPIADAPVPVARGTEPLGAFVDRMARQAAAGASALGSSRQFGGDARGSGISEPPPPPEADRWSAAIDFEEGNETDGMFGSISNRARTRLRPVFPVVAQGAVFVNDGLRLRVRDLSSGQVAWEFRGPERQAAWRDNAVAVHTVAVADGVVYAPLVSRTDTGDPGLERTFQGYTIIYAMPRRHLYAFDAHTSELLWSHEPGREEGREDAEELAAESISSPPLVVGDDVIVSTWTYKGIYASRLVCFDRRTGRTRWRTPVVEGQQELNLFGRPVKELVTSALAADGDSVYFATGLGVAAALERATGRIQWITGYEQTRFPRAYSWHQTPDREVTWCPSPVSIAGDRVVMAPPDSPFLIAFDLRTGQTRWTTRNRDARYGYQWFLGTAGGKAYLLGDRLAAIDLATGARAWTSPDAGRLGPPKGQELPAEGVGILTRDRVFVPTSRSIVTLSAATGEYVGVWALPAERGQAPATGNLVSGEGALLIVDRDNIHATYNAEFRLARLDAAAKQNPEDVEVQLLAGQARVAAGRLDEGIRGLEATLPRVSRLAPRIRDRVDANVRRALYAGLSERARLRAGSGDAAGAAADLAQAAEVARDRGDKVRALFDLATMYARSRPAAQAEEVLRRIAAELGDVVTSLPGEGPSNAGATALLRLGDMAFVAGRSADAVARWIDLLEDHSDDELGAAVAGTVARARLAALAATEKALVTTAVRTRARKALDNARAAGDAAAAASVARLYPDDEIAGQAAELAATLHLAAGRATDAVGVLAAYLSEERPGAATARARWLLASGYRALGETARERAELRRLQEDNPLELVDGRTSAADAAKRELADARFAVAAASLPDPVPPLALWWQAPGGEQVPPQPLQVLGSEPQEMKDRILLYRAGVLTLADAASGRPVWEQTPQLDVRRVAGAPHTIVVTGKDTTTRERRSVVLGLKAATGEVAWRVVLDGSWRDAATGLGVLYVHHEESGAGTDRVVSHLTALSLATGEVLATRGIAGPLTPPLTACEDAVVASQPVRERGPVHRSLLVLDGTTLSLRGRFDLTNPFSPPCVHPAQSSAVVTSDGASDVVALETGKGGAAWRQPVRLEARRSVKQVYAVPRGVIVSSQSDEGDMIARYDAASGREEWKAPLSAYGQLLYDGEAAEGDLIVATLKPVKDPSAPAVAVALDAGSGKERWHRELPATAGGTYPHPVLCGSVVAYELREQARSRVVLLDRSTGRLLQEIEHPEIGKSYQAVHYGSRWIALFSLSGLAVYGPPGAAGQAK